MREREREREGERERERERVGVVDRENTRWKRVIVGDLGESVRESRG